METDYPPLQMKMSGIFYKNENQKILFTSLSTVEFSSNYNSFGTGKLEYFSAKAVNLSGAQTFTFKTNICSAYAETDYVDYLPSIKENNIYSIFFQTSAQGDTSLTGTYPIFVGSNDISPVSSFGYFSWAKFEEDNILVPDSASFGYSMIDGSDMSLFPGSTFGYSCLSILTFNDFGTNNPYRLPRQLNWVDLPNSNYSSSAIPKIYFTFGNIVLYYREQNSSSYQLGVSTSTGINYFYTLGYDKNINLYLEVNSSANTLKIIINKEVFVGNFNLPVNSNTNFKIGYESKLEKVTLNTADQAAIVYDGHRINAPLMTVKYDNISIFKRALTSNELAKLYDLNINYIERYAEYGYTQLYDFGHLYSPLSTKYPENGESLINLMGPTSYLKVDENSSSIENMSYVKRYIDTGKEFAFVCREKVALSSFRTYDTVANDNVPISMIRGTGTLSFMFKTTDLNGLLFASTHYEYTEKNISIFFRDGNIEIWVYDLLRVTVGGYVDGEFHNIHIVFDTSSTRFYLNSVLYYNHPSNCVDVNMMTMFGNGLPGIRDLDCEYALIGFSTKLLTPTEMNQFISNSTLYSARGQITLNNIAIGTNVFIYNRDSGALIEKLKTGDIDGTFTYVNRYPYTISVVATDNTLLNGRTYIVDPVEVQ